MKQKSILIALTVLMMMLLPVSTAFAKGVTVKFDGKTQSFDSAPFIENNRTLVPFRGIYEAFDADVKWDTKNRTVTTVKDGTTIILTIGKKEALVNGKVHKLDVEPRIVKGRTIVPLRFVTETLGAQVEWEAKTKTVDIYKMEFVVVDIY